MMLSAKSGSAVLDEATGLRVMKDGQKYVVGHYHLKLSGGYGIQEISVLTDESKVEALLVLVLAEAKNQIKEVKAMAEDGSIPHDVADFASLHDHLDANMLGCGGDAATFETHDLVGVGTEISEAWCGVLNCAHNAVDKMIRDGGLVMARPSHDGR